jgi:hypothetical protein
MWVLSVKGHADLNGGGRETCTVVDIRIERWWPPDLPGGVVAPAVGGQVRALTPCPVRARDRRTLSPLVWQRWAWCRSRSTVAVVI